MSFISSRFGQFAYFDTQLGRPEWRGKRILDFGGNVGNMLKDPRSSIDHRTYWCIDVSRDAIDEGRRRYPDGHWIFFDRYNFAFNPSGTHGLPLPDIEQQFDFILAYSVFSHVALTEMIELIGQLGRKLADGGVLAFTFIDPHFDPSASNGKSYHQYYSGTCLRQRLERQNEDNPTVVDAILRKADIARWCTLVNDQDLYVDNEEFKHYEEKEKESFCTFYTSEYMQSLFNESRVLPPPHEVYPPTTEAVLQHCCILRKASE